MKERNSLIHIIPSNKWGGAQTYALDICRHYMAQGWEVTALTRNAVGVDAPFAESGIKLLHAPVGGFFDVASAMTLARKLKTTPIGSTVIHTHRYRDAFTAMAAKKIAKRPDVKIVTTRHTVRRGRDTFIFRKIYYGVNAHIFVSEMAYQGFCNALKRKIELPENKLHILHNSIYSAPTEILPEPEHGPVVALYQGALVKGKGLETLIDAMALVKGSKMRLRISGMGDPDYLDLLRRRAMQRDVMDNIDWSIKTTPSIEACSEAHFGVIPSSVREAFSLESLRFMAAARPQITTDNGAQCEYLEDGVNAFLIKPDNANELADAMLRLVKNPALRINMGNAAYQKFTTFLSWEHFINSLNKIYTT